MAAASANLHALAVELAAVPRSGLYASGKAVKKLAADEINRAGMATMHLPRRGRGRRAVRLRAIDTVRERGTAVNLRVQGVPVGLWVWANTGTDPHLVGAGRTRGGRTSEATIRRARRRTPYLRLGSAVRRPPVWHPGTRGRRVWRRVRARSEQVVPAIFVANVRDVVRRG